MPDTHVQSGQTPAEELATAAAKLRGLAADVPPPPWSLGGIGDYGWTVHMGNPTRRPFETIDTRMDSEEGRALARFIAVMHPGVGLALADWLETEARVDTEDRAALRAEGRSPEREHASCTVASCTTEAALAAARLVNGTAGSA